jgi:hypothetical protein
MVVKRATAFIIPDNYNMSMFLHNYSILVFFPKYDTIFGDENTTRNKEGNEC